MTEASADPEHKVVVRTDRHTRRLKAIAWNLHEPEGYLFVATRTHGYYFPVSSVREFRRPHVDQED